MPSPRERRPRARFVRVVATVLAAQLVAALAGTAVLRSEQNDPPRPSAVRARPAPAVDLDAAREADVRSLLKDRANAIRTRDRAGWLSTVDPAATAFRTKQAALFDALATVPLADWSYRLDPSSEPPAGFDLDRVRGPGWWAPGVTLSYRIAGFDDVATREPQLLTFVPRGGRWYVASDDDFAHAGRDTGRGLWDSGPVAVVHGEHSIVLGHPGWGLTMRRVAAGLDAAVPRVNRIWGTGWSGRVVALVPSSQSELSRIVGGHGDYSQIAAVATAELTDANAGYHPVGDRIVINPANFAKLGSLGRRVVLTHEMTHVATRSASGPAAPAWLVEGFADYVGYQGVRVPYSLSASELRDAIRRGQVPAALPADADFDGANANLAQVYEQAWLAVTVLADRYGRDGLLRFYRTVGRPAAPSTAVDDAFATLWGSDLESFTAAWRRDLVTRLR
ncbi:MAG: hypothetical protein NVS3B26_10350 [Mycobacteriales bacterium]